MTESEVSSDPIAPFMDELIELDRFVQLSFQGLSQGTDAKELLKALQSLHRLRGKEDLVLAIQERISKAEELEAFARSQTEKEFTYLFALASTRLWSLLEAAVEDLIRHLLTDRDRVAKNDVVNRISGPLVPFLLATEEERVGFLTEQLQTRSGLASQPGVGKFEQVLSVLDFGGPVDRDVRRVLVELSETRHIIVHRLGRVDRKFTYACPWIRINSEDLFEPVERHFRMYFIAAMWYLCQLTRRWAQAGYPTIQDLAEVIELMDSLPKTSRVIWDARTDVIRES